MKLSAAHLVPLLVCALAGSAWAAGDPKACNEGDKKACIEIGTSVANDEPPIGNVDEMRAECEKTKDELSCSGWFREEVKAGCRAGKPKACQTLGEGAAREAADEALGSTEELEARCKKKNHQACVDLAARLLRDQLLEGKPSAEVEKRANALLERGCKAGAGDGCARLGVSLIFSGKTSDAKRGLRLMKRACGLGSKGGCEFMRNFRPPPPIKVLRDEKPTGLGVLPQDDIGQIMKDLSRLSDLLERNCKLGYADACAELEDPAREDLTATELAQKIRKLEKQAAAGRAKK
jgi:TPR repeat protein